MKIKWDGSALRGEFSIDPLQLLECGYWVAAILLGAAQAWASRNQLSTVDAVSYLDIGDAYAHGHWKTALNGYWSPLYSWILGFALAIVRPSGQSEYATAKLVDYVVFLVTLAAFRWLLNGLRSAYRRSVSAPPESGATIPEWAWVVSGYTLFVWSSMRWIRLTSNTPDMCAAALTYGVWGILLRLDGRETNFSCGLLGVLLALGYFARTPFLIVGGVILVCVAFDRVTPNGGRGAVVAGLVLVALTAPFIVSMSVKYRHLTIGDSGKLIHIWLANPGKYIIPGVHWQGGPSGYGWPRHPSRQVWNDPPIFEFAAPIVGTYPLWTDPSYWSDGLTYHFDAGAEWRTVKHNLGFYYRLFGKWLVVGIAAALASVGAVRPSLRAAVDNARLWVPAMFVLALYVFAQDLLAREPPLQPHSRYVAAFITVLALSLAFSFRFRALQVGRVQTWAVKVGLGAVSLVAVAALTADIRQLGDNRPKSAWELAQGLEQAGVSPGMPVAIIGHEIRHEFWARLAKVRIVAQEFDDDAFWLSTPAAQDAMLYVFARAGAQAVVSSRTPRHADREGWTDIPNTGYSMRELSSFK